MSPRTPSSSSSAARALESVMTFVKSGNLQSASKPGFGHALKLSYNLMDKSRLSLSPNRKVLTYRYALDDHQVPKATLGLLTALMDELSTDALFAAGMPAPPGLSLQLQTELLQPTLMQSKEFDIINTVTKLGRIVSHTRTDFICTTTQQPLAFATHVKYMPIGNFLLDLVFTKRWLYKWAEKYLQRQPSPPDFEHHNIFTSVIGGQSMEPTSVGRSRFHITREHTNGFGGMHGGCHAMIIEHVGTTFAQKELGGSGTSTMDDNNDAGGVTLQSMSVEYMVAAKVGSTVDVICETIGRIQQPQQPTILQVLVKIQKGEKLLSEGTLRFVTATGTTTTTAGSYARSESGLPA